MKIILLLLIVIVLGLNNCTAQKGWTLYKIDNRLSVKLPGQPKKMKDGSVMSVIKDSIVCIVTVVDFRKTTRLDSAGLKALLPTQKFADELRTGMLNQMPGFTLGNMKIGKWKKYYTYSLQGGSVPQKLKEFTLMIAIGNNMYALSALVPYKKSSTGKDDFFNSVSIN